MTCPKCDGTGRFSVWRVWKSFKETFWALTLPLIILGGIFGGIVTATEGAALAVVAALFIGLFIYRDLNWQHLRAAIVEGTIQTGVVMLLVASSALLGVYLTEVQVPQKLAQALISVTSNPLLVLAIPVTKAASPREYAMGASNRS